uniref:Uncharacterized protein n=1 Tax=Branchiostoma floridae TaxID=7739 RepID=C3YSY9_BRAFL|eukprot:XP_002600545.1 hypothetical protein BRAFLDRAFT_70077 [Branchiostoma floridae]
MTQSQHIYNVPTDDPDTAEYQTIPEINQAWESPRKGAGNIQHLGSFNDGYEIQSPSLGPENGSHPQAKEDPQSHKYVNSQVIAASTKNVAAGPHGILYENDDELEYAKEDPQSHKYENSQMIEAAAKDAAADPQVIVNEDDYESVDNQSQTAAASGADSPKHYEPLRNPRGQQQHTYTSLLPHD